MRFLGQEDSPGGGHGHSLQDFCLYNPMDRGAWQSTVHRIVKSRTWLKWLNTLVYLGSAFSSLGLVSQSCLTLCNPMDCSLPGSSVHGILQARILEWVAIPCPGDLPNLGMEPGIPALQTNFHHLNHQGNPITSLIKEPLRVPVSPQTKRTTQTHVLVPWGSKNQFIK